MNVSEIFNIIFFLSRFITEIEENKIKYLIGKENIVKKFPSLIYCFSKFVTKTSSLHHFLNTSYHWTYRRNKKKGSYEYYNFTQAFKKSKNIWNLAIFDFKNHFRKIYEVLERHHILTYYMADNVTVSPELILRKLDFKVEALILYTILRKKRKMYTKIANIPNNLKTPYGLKKVPRYLN
ncbi:hypothetical protein Glove_219g2 [Diversispora epigaea]|uniref:Uncharacterized protein n=1 Tax=Diversispora epigaea TaxID=1348612 RepID=A0A397IGB6_9GLOM|nr:hypothetical protein Glove_219g2 [Diversispora epigaea]